MSGESDGDNCGTSFFNVSAQTGSLDPSVKEKLLRNTHSTPPQHQGPQDGLIAVHIGVQPPLCSLPTLLSTTLRRVFDLTHCSPVIIHYRLTLLAFRVATLPLGTFPTPTNWKRTTCTTGPEARPFCPPRPPVGREHYPTPFAATINPVLRRVDPVLQPVRHSLQSKFNLLESTNATRVVS